MNKKAILLFSILLTSYKQVVGQAATADQNTLPSSLAFLEKQYAGSFTEHPQLYNGPEYVDYSKLYRKITGHQFFLTPEKQQGAVYYNNHYFTDLLLSYDTVLDQLTLKQNTNPLTLRLINENVRHFTIGGYHFTRLVTDSLSGHLAGTGYYQVLVDSPVQLLAKRAKMMQEQAEQGNMNVEFIPIDKLFIRKAGVYYPVSSKRSVTKLFSDRSKEVQQYIQNNNLKFKKASREIDIVRLTVYYSSLATH